MNYEMAAVTNGSDSGSQELGLPRPQPESSCAAYPEAVTLTLKERSELAVHRRPLTTPWAKLGVAGLAATRPATSRRRY